MIRSPHGARAVLAFTLAAVTAAACVRVAVQRQPASGAANAAIHREIDLMMSASAAAWNRGDLDLFVSDYLPGQGTTFIGRRGVLRGVDAIRANYAARFAPGGQRDSLHFEQMEVDELAPNVANVIAWYVLQRGDSVTARGPTSLVMRKMNGRWRIVHDHSS